MTTKSGTPGMKLVGELLTRGSDWDMAAFGNLFGRLQREVKNTGNSVRHVRYEGFAGERCEVRFFGVEVERIVDIPAGMVGLDLDVDALAIMETRDGRTEVIWRGELAWEWFEESASGVAVGEFRAGCPSEWSSREVSENCGFQITANAYFALDKVLDDDVHLVDYDPLWDEQFEEIAHRIREELGPETALRVEHYGSTAIPGMPAKPVVDVLVEVPSFAEARRRVVPLFNVPECEYWVYSEHIIVIMRKEPMGRRTHHIHMAPAGHRLWEGLAFRDYLRTHPDDASRYAALKYELAERHQTDREEYTIAKEAFVREVTAKAVKEYSSKEK